MNLRTRKIISFTFIAIFFIVTPLTILYALGYNFNISWPPKFNRILQKTGMLIVDSQPKGAKIFINGQSDFNFLDKYLYSRNGITTTPAKIKNLTPGNYQIKFELDNYWPWEKRLQIFPGSSTFAEDVILFKKSLPILVFDQQNINTMSVSPSRKNLIATLTNKINIYDLINENLIFTASSAPGQLNIFNWSKSGDRTIINSSVYSLISPYKMTALDNDPKNQINKIRWSDDSSSIIYYLQNNTISSFDLLTKITTTIYATAKKTPKLEEKIIDFYIKGEKLFLVKSIDEKSYLTISNLTNKKTTLDLNLSNSKDYRLSFAKQYLELYDSNLKILYFIDPDNQPDPVWQTVNNINEYNWIDDKKIIYWNDFEIALLNIENGQNTLLTRISHQINGVIWHPSNNYVIYSADNSLYALELDERDRRIIIDLVTMDKISDIFLSNKEDALYFAGKLNHQSGLYKLAL